MKPRPRDQDTDLVATVVFCAQYDSEHYDYRRLCEVVQDAVQKADEDLDGFTLRYHPLDDGSTAEPIPDEIWRAIHGAAVVIAEVSDLNSNVLLELGAALSAGKKMIMLREREVAQQPLPFNIRSRRWQEYDRGRPDKLMFALADDISHAVGQLPSDFFDEDDLEHFLSQYLDVVNTTDAFRDAFADRLERCERNFYYVGSAGLASIEEDWAGTYRDSLERLSAHRVVSLRSLKEVHAAPEKRSAVVDHCVWLARYYGLVREHILQLYDSPTVGPNRSGLALLVFDQEDVLLSFGRLRRTYNHKALVITDYKPAGTIAYQYARDLVAASDEIVADEFPPYFELETPLSEVPPRIAERAGADLQTLREVCAEFVEAEINGLS